jgi:hypothetical protein
MSVIRQSGGVHVRDVMMSGSVIRLSVNLDHVKTVLAEKAKRREEQRVQSIAEMLAA